MDITVIPTVEVEHEDISLRSLRDKPKVKTPEIKAEKLELSRAIQKFDKKPRVYTDNPYAYNSVSLAKKQDTVPTPSAEQMITDPTYNTIGKFLGIDTVHDWNRYYDKVFTVTKWAKEKSGTNDIAKLMKWISSKSGTIPNMGSKNIDSLYLYARMVSKK